MKVVLVNGCFDLLHDGHVYFLKEAKKLGDWLVVVMNSDKSVRQLKGDDRPIWPFPRRRFELLRLGLADQIVKFDSNRDIGRLKPNVVAYGRDVTPDKEASNRAALKDLYPHAKIVFIPHIVGPTTTSAANELRLSRQA